MIKVAIADDDVDVLQYLCHVIDWRSEGFEVIGAAENGAELLRILDGQVPELLITDLTMPQMPGFELATCLRTRNAKLAIIFLTCHEDFHYAKHAIELQAADYLVKYTLTADTLLASVKKAKESIDRSREIEQESNSLYKEICNNMRYYKEKTLSRIIRGEIATLEEAQQRFGVYKIGVPTGKIRMAALYWDDYERALACAALPEEELFTVAAINVAEEILGALVLPYRGVLVAVCSEENCSGMEWTRRLRNTQCALQRILRVEPSVCVGGVYDNFMRVTQGIEELKAIRDAYFYGTSPAFVKERAVWKKVDVAGLYRQYIDRFKIALIHLKRFEMELDGICKEFKNCETDPAAVRKVIGEFVRILDGQLRQLGDEIAENWVCTDTLGLCRESVLARFQRLVQRQVAYPNKHPDIREVLKYIESNLDEKITLESAAAHIYKSSAHLSRLFHKETGKTFSEYLISKRIEKATYLLQETSLSVAEICDQIGVENIHYFYRFYKRETGKTPNDVRERA